MKKSASPAAIAGWCMFDWANSSYTTVIATFVFAAYFTQGVAVDPVTGTSQWGWAMSLSGLAVALASPVLGAVADRTGRRKPWLLVFTVLCVVPTALLWTIEPAPAFVLTALVLVAVSNFAFETGMVFYNAMLPDLVAKSRYGRVSGWGWGVGYFGGLACLVVALVGFIDAETPWFGLSTDNAEPVRATAVLVAAWFALFAIPLFVLTPDASGARTSIGRAVGQGLATLRESLRHIRDYKTAVLFLVAHMLYADGLVTLFAFGGIYAAGTFGMDFSELIVFGIAMNVFAGVGAVGFAWVDDRIGPKKTVLISLAALIGLGCALLIAEDKFWFWVFGLPLGIFVGPVQAASRSYMAHLAPPHLKTEFFGLFALSSKATAFLGPAVLAGVTALFASQRAGMASIVVFFAVGALLLTAVPAPKRSD